MGKSKRASRLKARKSADRRKKGIQISVIAFVIIIAGAAWISTRPPDVPPLPEERLAVIQSRGPENARVTITEFGDYNCPSCKIYHELGIIQQVLDDFPEDVRFVFRHFPIITPVSPELAEAAECASDQGAFWELSDLLFSLGPSRLSDVANYADQLGLDQTTFETCVDSRQYSDLVNEQLREAYGFGFRGTPSFMINETVLAGPPGYEQLVSIVEDILAN